MNTQQPMHGIEGKVVLITGASSGIGEATARLLATRGAKVMLGARRVERLEALTTQIREEGGTAEYLALDVTDCDQMEAFVQTAVEKLGRVDVIVNNAGVMPLSNLEERKIDEWNRMIDVNIRGVLHGIAAGLPVMRSQGGGQFINVASIGAYEVTPTASVYCATKYAVRAISEGLRLETEREIRVTLISPGVTESELADTISDEHARAAMREYRRIALPSHTIAEAIAYAIAQPEGVDVNEMVVRPSKASS